MLAAYSVHRVPSKHDAHDEPNKVREDYHHKRADEETARLRCGPKTESFGGRRERSHATD